MKKSLFFAIMFVASFGFVACGGDETTLDTTSNSADNIWTVDFPPATACKRNTINPDIVNQPSLVESPIADSSKIRPLVAHATPETFDQLVLNSKYPVVVDFFAEWCPPCKTMAPYVKDLAVLNPGVRFVKYDVDQDGSDPTAPGNAYSVSAIPTFDFFYLGKEYTQYKFIGANVPKLVDNLAAFLQEVQSN
ncbi:thioredoxin family protein [Patescibacteria group bacterium]|nr:thioredoxin family protein [Patescibacteria group bacterium]